MIFLKPLVSYAMFNLMKYTFLAHFPYVKSLLFFALFAVCFNTAFVNYGHAKTERSSVPSTKAKQAYIVDTRTGQVLLAKNADQQMAPSSMSKVMTMYMVFEALKEGRLSLDTEFTVSEKAWRMKGSRMFVEVGKQVKLEDLIRGVIVQSGNDAAVVLAEALAGDEELFAQKINETAQYLGMKNSHFVNASGWPHKEHYSTAKDLSILGRNIIQNFPEYYAYYSEKEFSFNNINQMNRNPLLHRNMGADGIKTGYTEDGGYGLIASAQRNDRRVVMVLNGMESVRQRAKESARLMEWALNSFENIKLFSEGETITLAHVALGKEKTVPLMVDQDVIITLPAHAKKALKVQSVYNGPLRAPLKKGQEVGTLQIVIPHMDMIEVPLRIAHAVDDQGPIAKTFSKFGLLFQASHSGEAEIVGP